MSFFEKPHPPPRPEAPDEPAQPEWAGPPRDVISGELHQRVELIRTDNVILRVGPFDCYSNGVAFSFRLWIRNDDQPWDNPLDPMGRRFHMPDPTDDEFLRLGILMNDGSRWANTDWRYPEGDEEPTPPLVFRRSSGGGNGAWRTDMWMWPLPPAGPVRFYAAWPAHDVAETSAVIEGADIRAAAAEAEAVWTD